MNIEVRKSQIMEIIGRKLFGISGVPKEEQSKMVVRAAKAAHNYMVVMEDKLARLKILAQKLSDSCYCSEEAKTALDNFILKEL